MTHLGDGGGDRRGQSNLVYPRDLNLVTVKSTPGAMGHMDSSLLIRKFTVWEKRCQLRY